MRNYHELQKIFNEVNSATKEQAQQDKNIPAFAQTKQEDQYEKLNGTYSYFNADDDQAKNTFFAYLRFFKKISTFEKNNYPVKYAYFATVMFGGSQPGKECQVLQKYLNEGYRTQTLNESGQAVPQWVKNPMHDAFATIKIQPKSEHVDLVYWRELINGEHTKKAIKLFARASDIANKFGPEILTSKSYELVLTKTYPKKTAVPGRLYIYSHKENDKLGYGYIDPAGTFIEGTIEKQSLQNIKAIEVVFADKKWIAGDLLEHKLAIAIQEDLFQLVNDARTQKVEEVGKIRALTESKKLPPIRRKLTLPDVVSLEGRLSYSYPMHTSFRMSLRSNNYPL